MACIQNGISLVQSYRGAGIACLRLGDNEQAIQYFTSALNCDKLTDALEKDILAYRVTAWLNLEDYDSAMADCQTLAENDTMDADTYFLTGKTALAMDAYDEASVNFQQAYEADATYETAIRIYQEYLDKGMEADGTRYLEAALSSEPKNAEDYYERGRVYYYMEDYDNARTQLIEAVNQNSDEALLLLGMVYLAQNDISNARAMFRQHISQAGPTGSGYNGLALCDIAEGSYDAAVDDIANGIPNSTTEELQNLLFNEIVAYEKKLDFATALQKAREYVEMFPEDEAAAKELAFLETRTQN
jgi:tetratricopeptide (TPR) repeat protein